MAVIKVLALLAFFILSSPGGNLAQASHKMTRFQLKDCVAGNCFSLNAPQALKPAYDSTIYLIQPSFQYRGETMIAEDGYFDVESGRIVLRGLKKNKRELSFEIKTGELKFFN